MRGPWASIEVSERPAPRARGGPVPCSNSFTEMSARRPQERPFDEEAPRVDPLLEVRETHRGVRPGDRRVKIVRPFEAEFERGSEGQLVASERTILSRTGWHSALRTLRTTLI